MEMVPIKATLFEDFIDGYFPLNVSLGHMLTRHGFSSAWILMRVAPMMEIPGLTAAEPVPLHLNPAHGGQVDWLAATIRISGQIASLSGLAKWHWNYPARANEKKFLTTLRLAEPAFLRGVGFMAGDVYSRSLGKVRRETNDPNILLLSTAQLAADPVSYKLKDKLDSALCWRTDFSQGLATLTPAALQPWACPYLELPDKKFEEGLLFRNTNNLPMSGIIADSLACL